MTTVTIEVEAKTDKAAANLEKLERTLAKTRSKSTELIASQSKLSVQAEQLAAAQAKAGAAMGDVAGKHGPNMQRTLERLGFAAHQVVGQTASLNTAMNGVLSTLGPWGIAIGAGVGILLHFASAADEAREKTQKLNDALRRQAAERDRAEDVFEHEVARAKMRSADEKQERKEEKARQQIEENHREEKEALEEMIVLTESRGKSAEGARRAQAALHEQTLREQADISSFDKKQELTREADKTAREEKLRQLAAEGRHEKELLATREKQLTISQKLAKLNAEAMKRVDFGNEPSFGRTGEDTLTDIEALSARKSGPRGLSLNADFSEINRNGMNAAEAQREAEKNLEASRAEWEKNQAERHEAEMARLEAELAKHEALGAAIGNSVADVAATMLNASNLSAAGFRKMLAEWGRAESIKLAAVAISEGVQALVSAAFFNFPQAALHGAAAGEAAAGAVIVAGMTGALGGFGSISKNAGGGVFGHGGAANGSNFGPGGSSPAANGPSGPTNSQTDTVPVSPQEAAQQSGGGSPSGGTSVHIGTIQVLGAIDNTAARKISDAIKHATRSGDIRKTG